MKPTEVHKTLRKFILADGDEMVLDLEKSHGTYIVDALTGKEWIDFFTFFASNALSFNHPKLKAPEFLEKLTLSAIHKPSNSDFYTTYMAEFVETFGRVAILAKGKMVLGLSLSAVRKQHCCRISICGTMCSIIGICLRRNMKLKHSKRSWRHKGSHSSNRSPFRMLGITGKLLKVGIAYSI